MSHCQTASAVTTVKTPRARKLLSFSAFVLGLTIFLASLAVGTLRAESEHDIPRQLGDPTSPSDNDALLGPVDAASLPGLGRTGSTGDEYDKPVTIQAVAYDVRSKQQRLLERKYADGVAAEPKVFPGQTPRCSNYMELANLLGGGGTVFSPDGRTEITSTTVYPYSAIGKIYAWFHDPNTDPAYTSDSHEVGFADCVGSGALIGACHVLTAGHVIFNYDPLCGNLGWANKVIFVPGHYRDGANVTRFPFGIQHATRMMSFTGWTQDEDENHDMGFLVLDEPIGNTTGWFGYSTADSDGSIRNISGYPADRNSGQDQFWMSGDINCENTYNLKYKIDTFGGQSGAPVWRFDGVDRFVHGVHAHGDVEFGCGFETQNRGVRITSGKFDVIQDWKADNDCPENAPDVADDGDSGINWDDLVLVPHKLTDLCIRIRNLGTRPVQRKFSVIAVLSVDAVVSRDDIVLGMAEVDRLYCFEAKMVKIAGKVPGDIAPGTYHVGWAIDPFNEVPERNELNNAGVLEDRQVQVRRMRQDRFRRGELNEDGEMNIGDPVSLLGFLFLGGKHPGCLRSADANDDGNIDISDVTTTLSFLFLGGVELRAPGPFACGLDESDDNLDCESYLPCK